MSLKRQATAVTTRIACKIGIRYCQLESTDRTCIFYIQPTATAGRIVVKDHVDYIQPVCRNTQIKSTASDGCPVVIENDIGNHHIPLEYYICTASTPHGGIVDEFKIPYNDRRGCAQTASAFSLFVVSASYRESIQDIRRIGIVCRDYMIAVIRFGTNNSDVPTEYG